MNEGRGARLRVGAPVAGLLLALAGTGCAPETSDGEDPAAGDPPAAGSATAPSDSARIYADRLMAFLGGEDAWDRTRYLTFRWLVQRDGQVVADREHAWDRYDGRYRVAFDQRDTTHLMLFDIDEMREHPELGDVPAGRAWKGGVELQGAARDSALRRAYGMFINDTYWALMPFKWDDPGVHLEYEGMRTLADSLDYATVHLTFDEGLGITEDEYWAFLDPETGRLAAWQYRLGDDEEPRDPIWWRDWREVGEIRFAMARENEAGERFIYFEDVAASATVPQGRFEPPTP
ncbi:MAG: DUF6503 family protein [Gemmatimonadota bacterium]|nr:DUF6503 family protein [Gemmatimonadota bacterium]